MSRAIAVAAVCDQIEADAIEQRTGHGVGKEDERRYRQHPSCRSPSRLENDEQRDDAGDDVDECSASRRGSRTHRCREAARRMRAIVSAIQSPSHATWSFVDPEG